MSGESGHRTIEYNRLRFIAAGIVVASGFLGIGLYRALLESEDNHAHDESEQLDTTGSSPTDHSHSPAEPTVVVDESEHEHGEQTEPVSTYATETTQHGGDEHDHADAETVTVSTDAPDEHSHDDAVVTEIMVTQPTNAAENSVTPETAPGTVPLDEGSFTPDPGS